MLCKKRLQSNGPTAAEWELTARSWWGSAALLGAILRSFAGVEEPRRVGSYTRQWKGRRLLPLNRVTISAKRHQGECDGCPRHPYLQFSLAIRTMIPTLANNVDSDGAVARVGFIRYAKILQVFFNADHRVMLDSPIFGVIYKVQRHRRGKH